MISIKALSIYLGQALWGLLFHYTLFASILSTLNILFLLFITELASVERTSCVVALSETWSWAGGVCFGISKAGVCRESKCSCPWYFCWQSNLPPTCSQLSSCTWAFLVNFNIKREMYKISYDTSRCSSVLHDWKLLVHLSVDTFFLVITIYVTSHINCTSSFIFETKFTNSWLFFLS